MQLVLILVLLLLSIIKSTMSINYPELPPYQAKFLFDQPGDMRPSTMDDEVLLQSLKSYPIKKIDHLIKQLDMVNGEEGFIHLVDLARSWGPRVDSLNLVNPTEVSKYLTHSYYVLEAAKYFINKGYNVLLIESTNSENIRCFKDIDLVVNNGLEYIFADITMHKPHGRNNGDWWITDSLDDVDDKLIGSKFQKLMDKSNVNHKSYVMTPFEGKGLSYILKFNLDDDSPYGKDFQKLSNIISLCKEFTADEVISVTKNVSPRLKNVKLEHGLVRSYPPLKDVYDATSVVRSLSVNDSISSKYHMSVVNHINEVSKDGSSKANNLYNTKLVEQLYNTMPKSTFFSPCISIRPGSSAGTSMVSRAKLLASHMIRQKKKVPPMTMIISLCTDDEFHPNKTEELKLRGLVSGNLWGHLKMKRVPQKDANSESPNHFFMAEVSDIYDNHHDFMFGGDSIGGLTSKLERKRFAPDIVFPDEYERTLDKITDDLYRPMSTGNHVSDLKSLINDSMPKTGTMGQTMRNIAKDTISAIDNTMLLNWLEVNNMVAESLSGMKKAAKNYEKQKNSPNRSFGIYVNEIGDRNGLVFSTTSYVSDTAMDCSICIEGDLTSPDTTGLLVAKNDGTCTCWYNLSRSDHDWTIECFPDFLSYYTMLSDMTLSKEPHLDRSDDVRRDSVFGLGLMIMNNTRFCQVSNQVRHMFNNCAGISNGTMDLYNKLQWYEPKKFIECTYMMRMHKMTTMMQLLKANEDIELALKNYTSEYKDGRQVIGYKKSHWNVAMPSVTRAMPTDQRLYSSFYTSYAFANNRYNLIFLQAQVFLKQVESREQFVIYRKSPRDTDVSRLPYYSDKYQLMSDMQSLIFTNLDGGQHKPCHLTVALSSMISLVKIHKPSMSMTISEIIEKNYESTNIFNVPTASSVANNRASVLSRGKGGNLPVKILKKTILNSKGKEKIVASTENQTAKSYETLFLEMLSFAKSTPLEPHAKLGIPVSDSEYKTVKHLTPEDITFLTKHTCKIWPTLLHSIDNNHAVVARMIHKDDQKPREIAIMNMCLRLIAYNLEEMARSIQKIEMANGDYTNLIEQEDKDKRSAATYMNYKGFRRLGQKVIFDNEDKSGWGPSQDPRVFFITLGMRVVHQQICNLTGLLLQRFAWKHFKVPDRLYMKSLEPHEWPYNTETTVGKALEYMKTNRENVYDKNRGCLYANEGMFQGTLSVTSSCAAADCMRFSCYVNMMLYEDLEYTVEGHVTSDDSVRAMRFSDVYTFHNVVRLTLHVHNEISKNYSYKRNMSCSVHSTYVYELNSVFHTSDGKIVPSIKSRLSYVTYSHELDMYSSALEIVSKASEYLRLESSVMGAYWVNVLKTWCHINQFQLRPLYRDMGKEIFNIPLEIGGLPTIDPLLSVCAAPTSNFLRNYGNDFSYLMTFFNDISKYEVEINEEITEEERQTLNIRQTIPRMTRSSVTCLMSRECKDKRIIRETVMSLPRSCFLNLAVSGGSVIKALIETFSREGVYFSESSLVNRFSIPQVPRNAKVFFIAPGIIREAFGGKSRVSREQIYSAAKSYSFEDGILETNVGATIITKSYEDVASMMQSDHDSYYYNMVRLRPLAAVPTLPSSFISKIVDSYVDNDIICQEIENFESFYKPKELGGTTLIHPVCFYDMKSTFSQKLRKMAFRLQRMKFTSMSNHEPRSVAQKLLQTNFIEGSSLIFSENVTVPSEFKATLHDKLDVYLRSSHEERSYDHPISLERCMKTSIFTGKIDITGLLSYGTSKCPLEWGSLSHSKASLDLLRSRINHNNLTVGDKVASVYMTQPGFPRKQQIYQMNNIYISQHPLEITHTGSYSKVVEKINNKYTHYISIWSGTTVQLESKGNDVYSYNDYTDTEYIRVSLGISGGILCVFDSGHIVMAICRDKLGLGLSQLISSNNIGLVTERLVREHLMKTDESVYEIYKDLSKFRSNVDTADIKTVQPVHASSLAKKEQISENMVEMGEDDNSSDSDDISLSDFFNFTILDDESSDSSRASSEDTSSVEEDDEDFGLYLGNNEESRIEESIAITSGDRDDPTPDRFDVHGMISKYGVNKITGVTALALRRKMPMLKNYIWSVYMPAGVNIRKHAEEVAIEVIDELERHFGSESMDFLWCKYYFLQSILADPLESMACDRIRTIIWDEQREEEGTMGDEDLNRYLAELGIDISTELES